MTSLVKFQKMLTGVHRSLDAIPTHRRGRDAQYTIKDAGLSAFPIFYLRSPNLLAYQKQIGVRRKFFNHVRALTCYVYLPSWDDMLAFMAVQQEVVPF